MFFDLDVARHVHRALVDHIARWGAARVPLAVFELAEQLEAMLSQPPPQVATGMDGAEVSGHGALMTYDQVAAELGMSRRTVSRRVADGTLDTAGRYITRGSVHALVMGK